MKPLGIGEKGRRSGGRTVMKSEGIKKIPKTQAETRQMFRDAETRYTAEKLENVDTEIW